MTGALILIEVPGLEGPDVQVTEIPAPVLADIRSTARRQGRSVWTEILARLAGNRGATAPPDAGRHATPPLLTGGRIRLGQPAPPAAR